SAQTELARAGRPGAPTLLGLQTLTALDLLGAAVLVRVAGAADTAPRLEAELEAAVVAVAGVDRPVATGLALGQVVPDRPRSGLDLRLALVERDRVDAGHQVERSGEEEGDLAAQHGVGGAEVDV